MSLLGTGTLLSMVVQVPQEDCPAASNVWRLIFPGVEGLENFWSGDTINWLKAGVKGFNTDVSVLDNSKFVAAIWIIWKARCSRNIKNVRTLPMQVARWTISFSSEIKNAFSRSPSREFSREKWVCWSPPMEDDIKLNTDEGLNLANRKGLRNIELEVDSVVVVSLLWEAYNDDHPLSALIKDCRSLMVEVNTVKINHIFREGNKCAGYLASLGHNSRPGVFELLNPPDSLFSFLSNVAMVIKFLRAKSKVCLVPPRGMSLGR
ncbi:Ribonuclease H domain [Dillenia turbinata]|uniref:Ribonuclease H domain n=1 Tax=Dillenia turbinata TaxID=194707 RepID=A0AAN8Z2N9_9MAGN